MNLVRGLGGRRSAREIPQCLSPLSPLCSGCRFQETYATPYCTKATIGRTKIPRKCSKLFTAVHDCSHPYRAVQGRAVSFAKLYKRRTQDSRIALQLLKEVREPHAEGVRDALRGRDGWRVPPPLDLSQVLGVHPPEPSRYVLKRLSARLPRGADGCAEGTGCGVSLRSTRHESGGRRSSAPESRKPSLKAELDMFPLAE